MEIRPRHFPGTKEGMSKMTINLRLNFTVKFTHQQVVEKGILTYKIEFASLLHTNPPKSKTKCTHDFTREKLRARKKMDINIRPKHDFTPTKILKG